MGPEATLDFFARVLAVTPADRDQDHLHLLIDNNPQVPNRNEAVAGTGPSPAPVLAAMAERLVAAGAEVLVMPCNAAHAFADAITAATDVPFLNIVTETVAEAKRRLPGLRRVGVLAAAGAHDAGLYRDAFGEHGVEVLHPEGDARERFMALLYRIKRGHKGADVRDAMAALASELVEAGAQMIIAGCTEVPLVLAADAVTVPLVNSTDVLVAATVAFATGADALRPNP